MCLTLLQMSTAVISPRNRAPFQIIGPPTADFVLTHDVEVADPDDGLARVQGADIRSEILVPRCAEVEVLGGESCVLMRAEGALLTWELTPNLSPLFCT